jgi:hypothetical protein
LRCAVCRKSLVFIAQRVDLSPFGRNIANECEV